MVATTKELILTFPAQHTLGNLYLSKQVFPHNRTWVGQAAGEAKLNLPPESMIGLADPLQGQALSRSSGAKGFHRQSLFSGSGLERVFDALKNGAGVSYFLPCRNHVEESIRPVAIAEDFQVVVVS